jgi:hypothetical protein
MVFAPLLRFSSWNLTDGFRAENSRDATLVLAGSVDRKQESALADADDKCVVGCDLAIPRNCADRFHVCGIKDQLDLRS